jgi:hypothetical protein
VFLAHGWVREPQDPFRDVSDTRVFVGILDHDAPVTVEAGRGVELVFTDVASYAASELVLPVGLGNDEVLNYDVFYVTYPLPLFRFFSRGSVTYAVRGKLVRVRNLLARLVQDLRIRISSLLPPNLSIIGHQGGYGMSEQTTQTCFLGDVFVDGEWGNEEFFHEEPEFWVSAHDLYVPLEWRPYDREGTKRIDDLLRDCRSLRDFWRRIAEMTLYNHALWLEQSALPVVGQPNGAHGQLRAACGFAQRGNGRFSLRCSVQHRCIVRYRACRNAHAPAARRAGEGR